ncbi:transposase family protein [Streptomyces bottropensis]|uniref:transposase family protein n=1 Tax=Streptomyces bottropensis TaxID=42235 RepID=UPI0036967A16
MVQVEARTTSGLAACPECGCWSRRIHGSYLRFPRDLPSAGKFVVVSLRVRRFVCGEESCECKTFAEQGPGFTRRFGRRTERLRSTLVSVGRSVLRLRAGAAERMDRDDEQLLRGRVYGTDHDHPGPLPHRDYAELVGGPLDGLLLDITGWTADEIQSGAQRRSRIGRVIAEGCAGLWWTDWSAARSVVAVARGSPVPRLRA